MIDHYKVLQVAPTVSQEALRERYRFLLQAFHPDRFSGAGQEKLRARAEEETKQLNASYDVLKNPVTRREYDRERQARTTQERERSAGARTPPPPRATPPPPPPRSPQLTAPTKVALVAVALILVALRLAMHRGGTPEDRTQRSETSAAGNDDDPVARLVSMTPAQAYDYGYGQIKPQFDGTMAAVKGDLYPGSVMNQSRRRGGDTELTPANVAEEMRKIYVEVAQDPEVQAELRSKAARAGVKREAVDAYLRGRRAGVAALGGSMGQIPPTDDPHQSVLPAITSPSRDTPLSPAQTAEQLPSGGIEEKQLTASQQTSSSPRLYTNRRHGYSIIIPAILVSTLQENASGDSVTATSNDGRTKLLVRVKQGVGTVETLYKQWTAEHTARDPGKVVNYKTIHGDWFVVSGYDGPRGYYVKVIVRGSEALFMALEYDEAARNLSDAMLTAMSRSFTAKLDASSGYQSELNPPFAAAAAKGDAGSGLQRTLPNGAVADPYANYTAVRPQSAQPPAPSPAVLSRVYTVPELKKLVGTHPAGAGLRGDFVLVRQEGNQVLLQSRMDMQRWGVTGTTNGQEDLYRGHTFVTVTCSKDISRFISGQLVAIPAEQALRIISVTKNNQGQIDVEASF